VLVEGGWFDEPETLEVRHVVPMSRERFLDLWRSHNVLATTAGPEGVAWVIEQIAPLLPERRKVAIPYVCRAWTARRRDAR
jgi:hypothetical protein